MFKSRFQLQFAAGLWPAASHFWRIAVLRKENGRFASAQAISPWSFPNGVRKTPGQESCGFLGFFAFPDYSSFCLKSRERRGQKVSSLCRKELRKRPFRPLCGPGRRVRTPAGAWTRRREESPQKPKFSVSSKRVSNFDISCVALDDTIKMAKANTIAFR